MAHEPFLRLISYLPRLRIVNDLDGGSGIQMFGHIAKKKAVHGEGHIRSTVDYVREGRKSNFG
jgi:hypothetical protein